MRPEELAEQLLDTGYPGVRGRGREEAGEGGRGRKEREKAEAREGGREKGRDVERKEGI